MCFKEAISYAGVAPMGIIEADDGLIAFDTGDTRHDGEFMLKAIRTVSKKPIKAGDIRVRGDVAEAARLINLFDRYRPEKAGIIPSARLEHAH